MEKNWIPNAPTQAWFDGTWELNDVERVQQKLHSDAPPASGCLLIPIQSFTFSRRKVTGIIRKKKIEIYSWYSFCIPTQSFLIRPRQKIWFLSMESINPSHWLQIADLSQIKLGRRKIWMPQNDLAYNFQRCSWSTGICGGMPAEIMGAEIYSNQVSCFFDDHSCCWVWYRKN